MPNNYIKLLLWKWFIMTSKTQGCVCGERELCSNRGTLGVVVVALAIEVHSSISCQSGAACVTGASVLSVAGGQLRQTCLKRCLSRGGSCRLHLKHDRSETGEGLDTGQLLLSHIASSTPLAIKAEETAPCTLFTSIIASLISLCWSGHSGDTWAYALFECSVQFTMFSSLSKIINIISICMV